MAQLYLSQRRCPSAIIRQYARRGAQPSPKPCCKRRHPARNVAAQKTRTGRHPVGHSDIGWECRKRPVPCTPRADPRIQVHTPRSAPPDACGMTNHGTLALEIQHCLQKFFCALLVEKTGHLVIARGSILGRSLSVPPPLAVPAECFPFIVVRTGPSLRPLSAEQAGCQLPSCERTPGRCRCAPQREAAPRGSAA